MNDPADPVATQYRAKHGGYFNAARYDLLALLPPADKRRLLELGAGHGATLRAAKAGGWADYTVGIDISPPQPEMLGDVDRFLVGNFESMVLDMPAGFFQAIICADVLEHLIDPWAAVRRLSALLAEDGLLLASVPNIRNHRALRQIVLRGDFRYQEAGLLDKTHLRFFCRRNAIELLTQGGLAVEKVEENMGGYGKVNRAVDVLTGGLLHEFFVFQYRLVGRKR
jgi:SAM-dependent methyltransferase